MRERFLEEGRRRGPVEYRKYSHLLAAHDFIFQRYLREHDWDHRPSLLLHFYRGQFYRYEKGFYRVMSVEELENELVEFLHNPPLPSEPCDDVTRSDLNNVVMLCRYAPGVFVEDWQDMPCWVGFRKAEDEPKGHMISMANGLLNVNTLMAGGDDPLISWSPRWFSTFRLDYPYDPSATCERWERFVAEIFEGDEERVRLLQMWFGYCLLPITEYQKFLLAVGEGANGKSVVFEVLGNLLGKDNVSHVPLERFGDRFALEATMGKLANLVSEIGELDKVAEGRLKEFVEADRMNLERKFRSAISFKPTARLSLATNTLPRFADRSQGLWRRMLLLPFTYTVPEAQRDVLLANSLRAERTGIFNWAIEGLRELVCDHQFIEPTVSRAAQAVYRAECDPARAFLQEHYQESLTGSIATHTLYERYRQWCQENGYRPLNGCNFGKSVKRVFPNVKKQQRRKGNERYFSYVGIQERA